MQVVMIEISGTFIFFPVLKIPRKRKYRSLLTNYHTKRVPLSACYVLGVFLCSDLTNWQPRAA